MAAKIKVTFDASNFVRRTKAYAKNIRDTLKADWPLIVEECLADVLSRAPDPATELAYLMGEDGGVGMGATNSQSRVSSGGLMPGNLQHHRATTNTLTHAGDNRVRFIRTPGLWLRELILNPATYSSKVSKNKMTLNLGNVAALEKLSKFSWINQDGSGALIPHTSEYGTWSFFEYGLSKYIKPRPWRTAAANRGNQQGHKLSPDSYTKYWAMLKNYPRLNMYGGFNKSVFIDAVTARINSVQF